MASRLTGSSPRGRGKQGDEVPLEAVSGLIPAWAGKTLRSRLSTSSHRAHPRVGGENDLFLVSKEDTPGSSPRGRGKLSSMMLHAPKSGLIPAWAGKTPPQRRPSRPRWAHPRVGGENHARGVQPLRPPGSSPRGRGKRRTREGPSNRSGLIPAWAGKTPSRSSEHLGNAAHPRVGGENSWIATNSPGSPGSSPRGRGKRHPQEAGQRLRGLIPAWAGKTLNLAGARPYGGAHPRVGGENVFQVIRIWPRSGSSPRGRGKRV